jgi:hypothetical protein
LKLKFATSGISHQLVQSCRHLLKLNYFLNHSCTDLWPYIMPYAMLIYAANQGYKVNRNICVFWNVEQIKKRIHENTLNPSFTAAAKTQKPNMHHWHCLLSHNMYKTRTIQWNLNFSFALKTSYCTLNQEPSDHTELQQKMTFYY